MHVVIYDGNATQSLVVEGMECCNGDVVEDAIAHACVPLGMVAGGPVGLQGSELKQQQQQQHSGGRHTSPGFNAECTQL